MRFFLWTTCCLLGSIQLEEVALQTLHLVSHLSKLKDPHGSPPQEETPEVGHSLQKACCFNLLVYKLHSSLELSSSPPDIHLSASGIKLSNRVRLSLQRVEELTAPYPAW